MTCALSPVSKTQKLLHPDCLTADQRRAVAHILEHRGAGLFLPMGFGKTIVTLTAIADLMSDRFELERVLIVAPKRVAQTVWHAEASRWAHTAFMGVGVCVGTPKQREAAMARSVVVVNVENLQWVIDNYGLDGFGMIVLDEASMFKDPSSKRFKALRRALTGQRVLALTGTPTGNRIENLWPVMYLLDAGERLLRTITAFRQNFMRPDKTNGHIVYSWRLRDGAFEEIMQRIADICISAEIEHDFEIVNRTVPVAIPEQARLAMRSMARELVAGGITAASAGVASNKLLQMASGAVLDDEGGIVTLHDEKIEALKGLIETMDEPVVVVYWYRHERDRLLAEIDGAVDFDRAEHEAAWNRSEIPVLLLHPAKGGHGLNLQHGGRQMIWFTLTWSLELYLQTCARLPRKGQKQTVYVHHLVGTGTIDERVMAALQSHEVTQQRVIDAVAMLV